MRLRVLDRGSSPRVGARRARLALALAFAAAAAAADDFEWLDPRLSAETVVDLDDYLPVAFAWAPGGRMLVAERSGRVLLVKEGVLQPTPFIDVSERVNVAGDRGLLGLAVDPDWTTNGYVYLLYTFEHEVPPQSSSDAPRTARLTRLTADPSDPDVALAGSEVVLLGSEGTPPCSAHPPETDCIPADAPMHTIGTVRAAPEGWLWLGSGEGASAFFVDPNALRAQDLDTFSGKILRVDRQGKPLADNPFHDGTDSIRSRVWAYGLRNPFRFTLDPVLGEPVIGDVGWGAREEIDRGRGANFGWPCFEGDLPQALYQDAFPEVCGALPESAVTPPLYSYPRHVGASITLGPYLTAPGYPDDLRGGLLFGDYAAEWLALARFDAAGAVAEVVRLAEHGEAPVAIEQGPDGFVYYLDFPTGRVRRIAPSALVARAAAAPLWGASPLVVDFTSVGSDGPGPEPLYFHWDFGDGGGSRDADPTHVYASPEPAAFDVLLAVDDGVSPRATARLRVVVGSTPPEPVIAKPAEGAVSDLFDRIAFEGSALDAEEGPLPAGTLRWSVLHHHDQHRHGLLETTGAGGSVRVPDFGAGEHAIEIRLTARDATGLETVRSVLVELVPALFGDDFEAGHLLKWSDSRSVD